MGVRMLCQHCRQSIEVSDAGSGGGSPRQPSRRHGHGPAMGESFVVLPQSLSQQPGGTALPAVQGELPRGGGQVLNATSMHEQLRTVGRLLELAEVCEDVECGVPLCEDCASGTLRELQRKLEEAHAEREAMERAFADLEAGDEDVGEDGLLSEADFEREVQVMKREEGELRAALETARREREALQQEAERLRGERLAQEGEEERRHAALNALELRRQEEADELMRQAQLVAHCEAELQRLGRVNVYNDVFHIWHDGAFGTISGLRLGRMPGVTVDWAEINAALGQVVLLVHTLAKAHGVAFSQHGLVPMGSFSRVYRLDEPRAMHELYGSGSAQLGRLFGSGRFDRGLTMLLQCVRELLAHAASRPRAGVSAQPPHPIEEDCVGGLSVRLQFNQEERWTAAFKYLLQDLKWLLTWHAAG